MKLQNLFCCVIILAMFLTSCKKKEEERGPFLVDVEFESQSDEFDAIPKDQYNEAEIFEGSQSNINKVWKAGLIERDGISGTVTTNTNFDFLLIKPNGIFGILRNDSLITTGEIVILQNTDDLLTIKFESEVDPDLLNIEILNLNTVTVRLSLFSELSFLYSNATMFLSEEV